MTELPTDAITECIVRSAQALRSQGINNPRVVPEATSQLQALVDEIKRLRNYYSSIEANPEAKRETHEYLVGDVWPSNPLVGDVWPSYPPGTEIRYTNHTGPTVEYEDKQSSEGE